MKCSFSMYNTINDFNENIDFQNDYYLSALKTVVYLNYEGVNRLVDFVSTTTAELNPP